MLDTAPSDRPGKVPEVPSQQEIRSADGGHGEVQSVVWNPRRYQGRVNEVPRQHLGLRSNLEEGQALEEGATPGSDFLVPRFHFLEHHR